MVSAKTTRSVPSPRGVRDTSAPLETARRSSGTTSVTPNEAFMSGSSKQGKARRASVDWNCVVATVCSTPSAPTSVLR